MADDVLAVVTENNTMLKELLSLAKKKLDHNPGDDLYDHQPKPDPKPVPLWATPSKMMEHIWGPTCAKDKTALPVEGEGIAIGEVLAFEPGHYVRKVWAYGVEDGKPVKEIIVEYHHPWVIPLKDMGVLEANIDLTGAFDELSVFARVEMLAKNEYSPWGTWMEKTWGHDWFDDLNNDWLKGRPLYNPSRSSMTGMPDWRGCRAKGVNGMWSKTEREARGL